MSETSETVRETATSGQRRRSETASQLLGEGRRRVLIEAVSPQVDGGLYPAKRAVGERIVVEADLVADGHDLVAGMILYRPLGETAWRTTPLAPLENDRWRGSFAVGAAGRWQYTLEAWVDHFASWRHALEIKAHAGVDVSVDLLAGARLVAGAVERAAETQRNAELLRARARLLRDPARPTEARVAAALSDDLATAMRSVPDRSLATRYHTLELVVDPPRAQFSAWYELFPRSWGEPGTHGTFRSVEERLDYVASMGFDVLYLPPIHPIGSTFRKGPNNALDAGIDAPGSPWAIGSAEGGHRAVHPQLGTLEEFERLVRMAGERGIDVAIDIAFQASPDHPYVQEHPEWFVKRADGTIQYAENPPKKYQDVYPFNFESEEWRSLWDELLGVFLFWIERGVHIFRVDNPHTKPLRFWGWCIEEIKRRHPDAIFLAEAFTRPKLMYALAKLGFSQSYTYFTWRNTRWELTEYLTELTTPPIADFFRPNFWPNTPDILPEHLQFGGRGAFLARMVMAATLSSNYGIYGPAFELMENVARPGSGEYIDSEKYQIRAWDLERPDSLRHVIARINAIRKHNRALHQNRTLLFHPTDNEELLCYSKRSDDGDNIVLAVVNLDPHHTQSGWVSLDLGALGVEADRAFQVHDMLGDARYMWHGAKNYVELDPHQMPAHIFQVLRTVRSEQDFDYFG